MITLILGALFMLGICIFIHELGHLLCGHLVGVKARIFSIGYGKGIWKKKIGSTIYQITAIPIGGYVLFKGDSYGKRLKGKKGELLSTPPLLRMIPVLGGPFFNLILGFVILFILSLVGDNPPSNRIFIDKSFQEISSPAYEAGLRTKDKIVSINGVPTKSFEDIFSIVSLSGGLPLNIEYERNSQIKKTTVIPQIYSSGGRPTIGIQPYGKRNIVVNFSYSEQISYALFNLFERNSFYDSNYLSRPDTSSLVKSRAIFYLKDGDVILDVEGMEVGTIGELQELLGNYQNEEVSMRVDRKLYPLLNPWSSEVVRLKVPVMAAFKLDLLNLQDTKNSAFSLKHLSLVSYDPDIENKLKKIKINGKKFTSFKKMKDYLIELPKESIKVDIGFLSYSADFRVKSIGLLGFKPSMKFEAEQIEKEHTILSAFSNASSQIYQNIAVTLKGISMLLTGMLSPSDNLSGPIGIVQFAGLSLEYGWLTYLDFIARISIALMIMNLLPIPLADGGHIVLYAYEAIVGKPVPPHILEIIFRLSFLFFIGLGIFVSFNDIMRFF